MNKRGFFAMMTGCLLMVTVANAQVPDDPFADVERLYASAAFEDALAALGGISGPVDADRVDEYRALCFLGLNRTRDAEQAVERLVLRRRSSTYDIASHPPKFVSLYLAVKKRTLPDAAIALYGAAQASFEEGQFVAASAQFKDLLGMLSDSEGAAGKLGDLKVLANGFSKLSEQRLAEVTAPAPPPPLAENTLAVMYLAPNSSRVTPMGSRVVYDSEDPGVIPPVIVDQRMPAWIPPNPVFAYSMFHGTLEVIVDESGAVESRTMSEPAFPSYDRELLNAAQRWKYAPATKDGRPVKYRKVITVTLGGS
jgi:TonB family protein